MNLNEYQKKAMETAVYPRENALPYVALGLTGEAGEFANKVKKILRGDPSTADDDYYKNLAQELGDVLWYVAMAAWEVGLTLGEVAQMNLEKLQGRAGRGEIKGFGDER